MTVWGLMKESGSNTNIDFEFIAGMVVKWYWVLLIPVTISVFVGIYLIYTSQRFYEARTVILVQPQKLPTDVVRNIIAEDINTRVSTLSQRIKSRTNLEKIIDEFHLFSSHESKDMYMEDKIDTLRRRISFKVTNGRNRNADSFAVTYKGTDPVRVTKITQSLASYIIDENLKLRETQVLGTNSFLEDELETMRKKLVKTETGLKEYRERYMGGLPEQLNSNLRILASLNERLPHARNEVRATKLQLDAVRQKLSLASGTGGPAAAVTDQGKSELERLKEELNVRLKRYTKRHPDVRRLKASIAALEEQPAEEAGPLQEAPKPRAASLLDRQRREILAELAVSEKELTQLKAQIAIYKKRVEDTPRREQELLSLQRDYENIRGAYHSLLGRQLEAQIAVNMEKKQKGEQFRIIDPARVPEKPVEPDMKKIVLFVLAAGLGLGCGVVGLLEFMFQTFRGRRAVESATSVPVIATIPNVEGSGGVRALLWKRVVPISGGAMAFSLIGVFLCLAYLKG
ncbi:tyrosine kinase g-rich domain [Desulfoluna spongiiphila]|nr:tyrosine kinase g-rich domain [Desulfoluna spongiiphila]